MSAARPGLDVQRASRNFSRAADGYERAARLQNDTREQLLAMLDAPWPAADRIVDLGCGTGLGAQALQRRYPDAAVIALDRAPGMARHSHRSGCAASVVGDAQALPLAAASVDLVFSNLVLQWCPQPARAIAEISRVLRPGGRALLSVPGPGTLAELRAAWRQIDDAEHVHTFAPLDIWLAHARAAGLVTAFAEQIAHRQTHADVRALMQSLRDIGARNASAARRRHWLGKSVLPRLDAAYAPWRDGAGVHASWNILYLLLERPR